MWHQEFMLTLTSNFGNPNLVGGGWQAANRSIGISVPQVFSDNSGAQYFFSRWNVTVGFATILNPTNINTQVVLQTPATITAIFALVTSSMTNTFTTTITTTIGSSTLTTTSTGVYAHDQVSVQLRVSDSSRTPSLLYGANVTITDDTGARIWSGTTDANGLTAQFNLKNTLIYTILVKYQGSTFSVRQQFPSSQIYPLNIAQQSTLTFQQISPWIIPIFAVAVAVIVLIVILSRRNTQPQQQVQWVRR